MKKKRNVRPESLFNDIKKGRQLVIEERRRGIGWFNSPGRHASFQDLAFSAAGVVSGGLFLSMARPQVLNWLRPD